MKKDWSSPAEEDPEKGRLNEIWSNIYWEKEAELIELAYWELIKYRVPNVSPPKEERKTEHKIEAFIRKLSRKHGIGNLHVGLTSSDLEDNIRIKRLADSVNVLSDYLDRVFDNFSLTGDQQLIAYTHLLPAGVTNLRHRFFPYRLELLPFPIIKYKGIGGALGDSAIQNKLGLEKSDIDGRVFPGQLVQWTSSQTVDHTTEFQVACWLTFNASLLAKVANDFRQMFAFGQARHIQKDIGSTAIPGKAPNPWRFERVSGRAEAIYPLPGQIARVASECLLERTLTNQSILDYLLKQAFYVLLDMAKTLEEALDKTEVIDQSEECKKSIYHSEEEMLKLILKGVPREEAHRKINERHNKGKSHNRSRRSVRLRK